VIALGVLAAVVLVLVLLAPALDRAAALRAERRASDYLTEPFGGPATVRVEGRPFLTQVARGVYRQIEVVGTGLRVGEIGGVTLAAHLTNVHLPLRELLGRRTREVACERVEGRLVLPYDELARLAPIPGLSLRFGGEKLVASAAVPVPGLNQIARVRGEAVLTRADTGSVWLRINGVSLVGVALPSILWNQLLPTLDVRVPLPDLPYGLRIDELRPTATGLVVDGSAAAVVFRRTRDERPTP
jgi:hypothetical protein